MKTYKIEFLNGGAEFTGMTIDEIKINGVRANPMEIDVILKFTSGTSKFGVQINSIPVMSLNYDPVALPLVVQAEFDNRYEVQSA